MKRSYEMDLCSGPLLSKILLFSLPLMLGSVFQQLYTIVDTIIIGRGVGMQALASIGAADWINWLVLWGLQGFTQGFAILAAQEFGAGAYDRLRRVLAMIVKLSCWFGIAVTIISLLLVRPLLTLLHTDPAVFGGAQTYLYVQFGGSLIIIAYNMAAAVLRCLGDSRTPLFAIIAASFANIALDLLFVMGFGQYFYMSAGQSCGPRDSLTIALGKRFPNHPVGLVQSVIVGVVLLIGWVLDGPIGIGTVISVFVAGTALQIVCRIMHFEPRNVKHLNLLEATKLLLSH